MRILFIALLLVGSTLTLTAQEKLLTIEDAVMKGRTTLAPERLQQLQWVPNSTRFAQVVKTKGTEVLVLTDATNLSSDTVLTVTEYAAAFQNILPKEKAPSRLPMLTFTEPGKFRFVFNNGYYLFNIADKTIRQLAKAAKNSEHLDFDPASNRLAYVMNNNLHVFDPTNTFTAKDANAGDEPAAKEMITKDGSETMVYAQSAHRNEFGITKGTFFSPMGNRIAFYQQNEAPVSAYELMDVQLNDTMPKKLSSPTHFNVLRYPMAGNSSHQVKVKLYDFKKKQLLEVATTGDPEQYLTNIAWSPNEEYLYIAVLNRDQNEMKLQLFDGATGSFIKTLFTETHPKYVEPEKPVYFIKNDGSRFIWFSERDGHNHLYLYNSRGELQKQLTKGNYSVTEILGTDDKGTCVFFHAVSADGLNRYVQRVDLKTGAVTTINKLEGVHTGILSPDGNYILDQLTSASIPRRYMLMDQKGKEIAILLDASNPIRDYKPCQVRLFSIPSTDGKVSLNCRMMLPANFDSTKKYPVVVYVYGGPHAQMVTNSWLAGGDLWLYFMAQQGYIMFTLDNRGSMNRGQEFEQATFRNLGKTEVEDQLAGVSYLKKLGYVDPNRMGVYGWSFGGFMSTSLMTKTPGVFKVGVAGGPVIDWRMYEIMYTERYMDKPQDNPEGYRNADLTNYAKNLKGKLLLIHGVNDNTVLWQHSLTYLKKCVDEGVLPDYFVYPGHEHNVLGPDRVHLMKKITQYLKENL